MTDIVIIEQEAREIIIIDETQPPVVCDDPCIARYTNFVGNATTETNINSTRTAIPLTPLVSRTVEQGAASWWDSVNSRLRPDALLSSFSLRLIVLVRPVNPANLPIVIFEMNNAPDLDPARIVAAEKQPVTDANWDELGFTILGYAGANLVLNGGKLSLRTYGGNVVIKDPRLLVRIE